MKKVLHNPLQFLQTDKAVIVDVKNFEDLLQVVLRSSIGHDVKYNHKFSKIDVTVLEKQIVLGELHTTVGDCVGDLVGVVHPEDVALQLLGVSARVTLLHHRME